MDYSWICSKQGRTEWIELCLYVTTISCFFLFITNNIEVSEEQKERFRTEPETYLKYRKEVEHELNCRFKFVGLNLSSLRYSPSNLMTRFSEIARSRPKLFVFRQMR